MTGNPFASLAEPDDAQVNAVMMTESGGRPDAVSPKGAMGPMQLMPGTARDLGVDPANPFANIEGGARYLDQMMQKYGDEQTALMAYNWGPRNVDRWIAGGRKGPVPTETKNYVQRVLSRRNPVGTAQAAEPENPFEGLAAESNPFEALAEANPFEELAAPRKSILNTGWDALTSGVKAGVSETGDTLTGPFAEGAPHREEGYLGELLQTPISKGALDPHWWVANIMYGAAKSSPSFATGIAGTIAGAASPIPGGALIGGAAGFGVGAMAQTLAAAYKEARARNLDHDQAVNEAMTKAGIAGLFGAASGAAPGMAIFGKVAAGVNAEGQIVQALKKPISEALAQIFGVQPGIGAAQQMTEGVAEGRVVSPEELLQGYALNVGQGAPPVAVHAGARAVAQSGRRVGTPPPSAPPPGTEGPEPGTRVVLGLEEQVADPETGGVTKSVTPADVTIQGYDPETGMVTLTRDADGVPLGPMPLEDFNALRRPEEPGPLRPSDDLEPAPSLTEADVLARDQALDVAQDRGFAEDPFHRPMKPIPTEPDVAGEVPFAPGLPEERGKRPFMQRDPRPTTPELPGMEDAEQRMAFEMDVAEEADRRAPSTGKAPPQDLVSFLADNGGMRDEGGELRSMDLDRQIRPGQTKLIREDGAYQDAALERAIEGGYLPEDATVRDLLDAIDDTARGRPVYSQIDMGDVNARREAAEAKAQRSEELRARAAELGIDPKNFSDRDLRRQVKEFEDADRGEAPVAERKPAARAQESSAQPSKQEIEFFKNLTGADVDFTRLDQYDRGEVINSVDAQSASARTPASVKFWERQKEIANYVLGEEVYPPRETRAERVEPSKADPPKAEITKTPITEPAAGETFTTAKGSTYEVHEDGSTTRNKMFRPEHGEKEQGPQPRSEATFYVDREGADALGLFQATNPDGSKMEVAPLGDGRWGVRYVDGPNAGKFARTSVVTPQTKPAVGLTPIEIWKGGRRVHFGNEITEVKRGGADITKTPEGAYALKDTDGEPLGAYSSKKKAQDALNDKRATNDAVEGMTLRREAEIEAAAKAATESHKGKGPPKDIERQTALLDTPPPSRVRMKDLGAVEAKAIFPRTLAMLDRSFAKLFKPVQKREEAQTRNYRDFFWQAKPLGELTKPSRDQVYKAAVIARLANRNIVPTGARLVIKNGDRVVPGDDGKTWLAPGETIKLTKEETDAYFALKSTMQNVWRRHTEAVVRNLGYDGDMKALRDAAASKSDAAKTKFLEEAKKPEAARTAMDLMSGLLEQEKAGYIPFQRRGDVMITVKSKTIKKDEESGKQVGVKEGETDKGVLGGEYASLHSELVDSGTLRKGMFGRKFEKGDYGKAVAAKVKELRERYKDDGQEPMVQYISEMRQEDLPLNALERLVSGISHENPDLRKALMDGFMKDVVASAKSGFRKKSDDIAGFSTDFDRMVTEYLHHTARVLPMIEFRNEIAGARDVLMGGKDSKGKAIPPEGSQSVRRYADKWLRSVDDPGGDFAGLRKLGFAWWILGSPAPALANLSQTHMITIPVIGKWAGHGRSFMEANKVLGQVLRPDKMMFGKKQWGAEGGQIVLKIENTNFSENEKTLLKSRERNGLLQAQVTSDMLGNNIGKSPAYRPIAKMMERVYSSLASMFGAAEVTNRVVSWVAAYRLAHQPGALKKAAEVYKNNQLFQEELGGKKLTPEFLADWETRGTQFDPGRANTPELMRGVGAPITQFKKYPANYISLLNRQFRHEGPAGKIASTMMLASLVAAAGIKGLPFAEDTADAVDWATTLVTKIDPAIEMNLRHWLRDGLEKVGGKHWGDIAAEMLMSGPSRYLTGTDSGQRFGMGRQAPHNVAEMFGPLAGAISQGATAGDLYSKGQNYQATSKLLPKALGNIVSAVGLQEEGTKTAAGNPVMAASEYPNADVGKQLLGLVPAERARRYENIFDLSKIDADARRATAGFYRELAISFNQAIDAEKTGDTKRAAAFMDRFQATLDQYRKNIEDPNRPEWVKFKLSRESLKREIANAMDWSRRFTKGSPKQARPEIMRMTERMAKSVGESTSLDED